MRNPVAAARGSVAVFNIKKLDPEPEAHSYEGEGADRARLEAMRETMSKGRR